MGVRIGLSAVIIALRDERAMVLTTQTATGDLALPFGPFDPARDRTFELALRAFVTDQTGFRLAFVEQLYTFGDAGREAPRATPGPERQREVSVGYLALTRDASVLKTQDARWTPVFDIFPWEDRRRHQGDALAAIAAGLAAWAGSDARRQARADGLFALSAGRRWNEERVLDRYELLYEAGLTPEAARDRDASVDAAAALPGLTLASDHRRILATGLGRLRSKMKYRPVLFDLTPETFTLSQLQQAAEAVAGLTLHKQNFRRGVERAGLVQATGRIAGPTGGRPAELFRYVGADPMGGPAPGLPLPGAR